ncbi:MAG TPA: hypothetical protein P5509_01225 [Bacteroidales bacterium]|jgi:hypothetical protein|nr:hypothetical protein [Bacteroidales bacterium]
MKQNFNSTVAFKENGTIDSLQVIDPEEAIDNLKEIGVLAKQSIDYGDEIDIVEISNKPKFKEWLRSEKYNLATYPRLKKFLK